MEPTIPAIGRTTFLIHVIVAIVVGVPLLVAPLWFGGTFGYVADPGLQPPLRAYGAMMLGFGGFTSFLGRRAATWEQVDFVVRGEMVFLALQTLVFALSALSGVGPAFGNWVFAACSVILFMLFTATFAARPR